MAAMKPQIHFAHANGFPSASYRTLLEALAEDYDVRALPLIGHDPAYPVSNNWPHLKRQLIDSIEQRCDRPVIGLGHSLGGGLTMMAALERPELFTAVILLDAPVFSRFEGWAVRMIKALGLIDNVTPAGRSKYRRTRWPDADTAYDYFRTRGLFSRFHDQCLRDYLASATRPTPDGELELAYELPVELAIFRTVPHTLAVRAGQLAVPAGLIAGRETDTVLERQYLRMKHRLGFNARRIAGGHMFPLEHPLATAEAVDQVARELLGRTLDRTG